MAIEVNGYTFETFEHGSGVPLIFVHGSASDHRTWKNQYQVFGEHFRTISYSRRYHWPNQSINHETDYSMAEHVQDLDGLIRTLDADPTHLVGHSYGAIVCLLLVMQSPELVRTLVLAEPPAITLFVSNSPKPSEILKLMFSRPRTAVEIIKFGANGVAPATEAVNKDDLDAALRRFGRASLGGETFRNLSLSRLEQARDNLIKEELLGSGFPPLDDEQIRKIQTPTVLLTGQKSPALYSLLMDRLQELMPHAERVEIPSASHIMHEDNPSAYNDAVLSFLVENT